MKKIALLIIVSVFLSIPSAFFAADRDVNIQLQIPPPGIEDVRGYNRTTQTLPLCTSGSCEGLKNYIATLYKFLTGVAALFALAALVYAGIIWLTAGGNTGRVDEARKIITNALAGLALALGSFILLTMINPALIALKPLELIIIEKRDIEHASPRTPLGNASVTRNINEYDARFQHAATTHGIDCTFMKAMMYIESNGNPNAVSPKDAVGLMQMLPTTAGLTSDQLKDPTTNINAAAQHIASLGNNPCPDEKPAPNCRKNISLSAIGTATSISDEHIKYVLAAYNGGQGANRESWDCRGSGIAAWECPKNPGGYVATQRYVPDVLDVYKKLLSNGWGC